MDSYQLFWSAYRFFEGADPMRQLSVLLCIALSGGATTPLQSPLSQVTLSSGSPQRVEMAGADLLSRKDWTSAEVQVAGLYLGMSRNEAMAATGRSGFRLMQYGPPLHDLLPCSDYFDCFLATTQHYGGDVAIKFGIAMKSFKSIYGSGQANTQPIS